MKSKSKITRVKNLAIGDRFYHVGILFKVTSFPTRHTVCGDNCDSPLNSQPATCKVPIRTVTKCNYETY